MSVRPIQTTRLDAAGNIKGSAGSLFWIVAANPTAAPLNVTVNNATSGTGSEIFQIEVSANDTQFMLFSAGFYFSTGIRCGTLDAGLIVTGAYE